MAPTKQATLRQSKRNVRSKKASNREVMAKARAAKLAKRDTPQQFATPEAEISGSTETEIPVKESASKRKLDFFGADTQGQANPNGPTLPAFAFIDTDFLHTFIGQIGCEFCSNKLTLKMEKRTGSVFMLKAKCLNCETLHATAATSKSTVDSKHYEINRRLVASFLNIGLGYAAMESFCEALGIDSMTSKTYRAHLKFIENKNKTFIEDIRAKAIEKVRSFYGATSKEDTIDITVSFDGSWQKRGHTSKHGLGVVIETTTGLAVDFHVMSTYCQKCSTTGKNMLKRGKAVYDEWFKRHELDCTINHSGSSGLMEVNAAKVMWLRSQNLGFRYTTFVSDGDCKTYKELQSLAPYSVPIKKEECINHVSKRLGTALRNLVTNEAKLGTTLGGRKAGSLSQVKINLLQRYYKKAVSSKCSTTEELRKKIMTTFKHASSTDERPQHDCCPTGKMSWCFWQRALAHKLTPPSHKGKSSSFISQNVADKVRPIYERLTSDILLERCLGGMTQNANESIHSKIWARCPKQTFLGKKRVEIGTALAVSEFNFGSLGLHIFMSNIGCPIKNTSLLKGKRRDAKRVSKSEKKESVEAKRRRKEIVSAQIIAQQEYFRSEGGHSYESGKY
ncbi:hypothetical protein BgiBS90_025595 [Biomphalaria glabrata]|nr:hypothetical protein BgiBS90_025595 [Biomphalaria glabrata]